MFIPQEIRRIIGDRPYHIDNIGMSDSTVICFDDMVLKVEKQREEADNELRMMRWLDGRLPVPRVLHAQSAQGFNYLLMSRITGKMSCDDEYMRDPRTLIRALCEGLRMLWAVDVSECPYRNDADNKLRLAAQRVERGLCSMDDVEPDTYGENGFASPQHLLEWLRQHKPQETPVLSHGDYCLPNIFLQDGRVSGLIDLGRCGTADKYQDIALCYRSLLHNSDGAYGKVYPDVRPEMLFEELGITPDMEKIRYYILLDELF